MAERIWHFTVNDATHEAALQHSSLSGEKRVYLDGELIHRSRQFIDFGLRLEFLTDGAVCELRISTNGITFRYQLSVDGRAVRHDGDNGTGEPAISAEIGRSRAARLQRLADLTGLTVGPSTNGIVNPSVRVAGMRRGLLVSLQPESRWFGSMPLAGWWLWVRFHATPDPRALRRDVEAWLKANRLRKWTHVQTSEVAISLRVQLDVDTFAPEAVAAAVNEFVDVVLARVEPLRADACEMDPCKTVGMKHTQTVFIDGVPRRVCDACLAELPATIKSRQRAAWTAPTHLGRALLASMAVAAVGLSLFTVASLALGAARAEPLAIIGSMLILLAMRLVHTRLMGRPSVAGVLLSYALAWLGMTSVFVLSTVGRRLGVPVELMDAATAVDRILSALRDDRGLRVGLMLGGLLCVTLAISDLWELRLLWKGRETLPEIEVFAEPEAKRVR